MLETISIIVLAIILIPALCYAAYTVVADLINRSVQRKGWEYHEVNAGSFHNQHFEEWYEKDGQKLSAWQAFVYECNKR